MRVTKFTTSTHNRSESSALPELTTVVHSLRREMFVEGFLQERPQRFPEVDRIHSYRHRVGVDLLGECRRFFVQHLPDEFRQRIFQVTLLRVVSVTRQVLKTTLRTG